MTDSIAKERESAAEALHEIYRLLGAECAHCGFKDTRALQIDHINGDSEDDLKRSGNKRWYYRMILRSIVANERRFQVLCANCNWIKRVEKNETPPRLVPEQLRITLT